MYSVLLTTIVAFCLCLILTPVVRDLFLRWGIVDSPDGVRKLHAHAVPRVGGIPIAVSYLATYLLLILSPLKSGALLEQELPLVWDLMPVAALAFATGLLDDLWGLKPAEKLGGQLVAAVLAYWAGVRIASIAGYGIADWWSFPLTIIWLIGCTNAFNLIDGVDGVATGIGLFATLTIFIAAVLHNNTWLALATAPLAGCLLGFLRYNFNPASIFLGDSGSLLVGFLLGCYGVIWSQKSATILGMTAPLMALAIPLMDTALAVLRRFLRGRPIFAADRGHVHHRLLDLGLTPRRVALLLYGACGMAAALSLLQSMVYKRYAGLVVIVFLVATWLGIQKLGYNEFGLARRLLFGGEMQNTLNAQISLQKLEQAISRADTIEHCWSVMRDGCGQFGFSRVELHLAGRNYEQGNSNGGEPPPWYVHVPLSDDHYVLLCRNSRSPVKMTVVAPLADLIRSRFRARLAELIPAAAPPAGTRSETRSLVRLAEAIRRADEAETEDPRPRAGTAAGS